MFSHTNESHKWPVAAVMQHVCSKLLVDAMKKNRTRSFSAAAPVPLDVLFRDCARLRLNDVVDGACSLYEIAYGPPMES